jgi:argininosuccinate lyase
MIEKTEFNIQNIKKQLSKGFLNATDIAEHFVKMNIPFREAHEIVGKMVKYCEVNQKDFMDLTDEELYTIDRRLSISALPDLSMEGCINGRVSYGGTAPSEVKRQIEVGRAWLNELV